MKKIGYVMCSILTRLLSKSNKTLLLIPFLFANPQKGQAQIEQAKRYEYPIIGEHIPFEVIPAGEAGLFTYRSLSFNQAQRIELTKLDTTLAVNWSGLLPLEPGSEVISKIIYQHKLHILARFRTPTDFFFELYSIDIETGNYSKIIINTYIAFNPSEFKVTEYGVIIGGYFNSVPLVIFYDLSTKTSKVLPGLFNSSGDLTHIKISDNGHFDVLVSAKNYMRQNTIWVKNYDQHGNLLVGYALEPEEKKSLLFARSLKTINNVEIIAGVFGNRNSEYSKGIFIAAIEPSGLQKLRYYEYADLENFFQYMKAKRENRVKSRIERRKIKGKKNRMNYRFLIHELVPYNDQYILLGEAFYPKYSQIDRTYGNYFLSSGMSPNSIIRDGRIFEGYHYTHAAILGFDKNGNLLWDNSFEINDVRTFTLEQYVKLEMDEDKIDLIYLYENKIRTKVIKNEKVLEGKSTAPLQPKYETDIIARSNTNNTLEYWYDKYFIAFGTQQIENLSDHHVPQKRNVFFINKVKYN